MYMQKTLRAQLLELDRLIAVLEMQRTAVINEIDDLTRVAYELEALAFGMPRLPGAQASRAAFLWD